MHIICLSLVLAACCGAQAPTPLRKLTDEAARVLRKPVSAHKTFWGDLKETRANSVDLETALRDWIESQLPKTRAALDVDSLAPKLNAILDKAGLLKAHPYDYEPGFVNRVELSLSKEAPGLLKVIAGVDVPCGEEDVVYVYDYNQTPPHRILESHPSREHDETVSSVHLAGPDPSGAFLVLTLRYAVQCGSNWNQLSYDAFRYQRGSGSAAKILAREHGYFGGDYHLRFRPDGLLLQFAGGSIDTDVLIRNFVFGYDLSSSPPRRIDPVALSPRDFVDEWWSQTWDEMAARSLSDARESLRKWHESLTDDAGNFAYVQACAERPGEWQVGFNVEKIGDKDLAQAQGVYFLVHESPGFRYRMDDISYTRQPGCPGEGDPSGNSPSLFPTQDASPDTP